MTQAALLGPPALREKHDGAPGAPSSVRLWLRLLSCATVIEKRVRSGLAAHGTTLPRFDVMAALDRHPDGMTLGALSASLLVSNGNVTALVRTLVDGGEVRLGAAPGDRRATVAALTPLGGTRFAALAAEHHAWIAAMFARMDGADRETLYCLLGQLKLSIMAEEDRAR